MPDEIYVSFDQFADVYEAYLNVLRTSPNEDKDSPGTNFFHFPQNNSIHKFREFTGHNLIRYSGFDASNE